MRKYTCADSDFDTQAGVCANPVWTEDAGILPPLSASEGATIAAAIVGVWVVGATFRWAIHALRSS